MGLLVNGKWHNEWYDTASTNGEFVRQDSQFRNHIGSEQFSAEPDRYHLFVSLACPWAHRTLIFRKLKHLENVIGVTVVKPKMLEKGWETDNRTSVEAGYDENPIPDINYLYEVYTTASAEYTGRVTVPILWDKRTGSIVNNESSEIIRMFNSSFNHITGNEIDYYPEDMRDEVDTVNALVYDGINNGVYKAGFATTQEAYEKAFYKLFYSLDLIEDKLSRQRYIAGKILTEADWRLFTTLIRFDAVYYGHFKANKKRIEEYPNISNYLRELYQYAGVSETVNFDHIKTHYYYSHETINPTRIIPIGPELDFYRPHNRADHEDAA